MCCYVFIVFSNWNTPLCEKDGQPEGASSSVRFDADQSARERFGSSDISR